jgi:hypothetical protein
LGATQETRFLLGGISRLQHELGLVEWDPLQDASIETSELAVNEPDRSVFGADAYKAQGHVRLEEPRLLRTGFPV